MHVLCSCHCLFNCSTCVCGRASEQAWVGQHIIMVWSMSCTKALSILFATQGQTVESMNHSTKPCWQLLEGAAWRPGLICVCWAKTAAHLQRLTLRTSLTLKPTHWDSASLFIFYLNNSQIRLKQLSEAVLQKAGVTQVEMSNSTIATSSSHLLGFTHTQTRSRRNQQNKLTCAHTLNAPAVSVHFYKTIMRGWGQECLGLLLKLKKLKE